MKTKGEYLENNVISPLLLSKSISETKMNYGFAF
jgi:hypothetical protein